MFHDPSRFHSIDDVSSRCKRSFEVDGRSKDEINVSFLIIKCSSICRHYEHGKTDVMLKIRTVSKGKLVFKLELRNNCHANLKCKYFLNEQ